MHDCLIWNNNLWLANGNRLLILVGSSESIRTTLPSLELMPSQQFKKKKFSVTNTLKITLRVRASPFNPVAIQFSILVEAQWCTDECVDYLEPAGHRSTRFCILHPQKMWLLA